MLARTPVFSPVGGLPTTEAPQPIIINVSHENTVIASASASPSAPEAQLPEAQHKRTSVQLTWPNCHKCGVDCSEGPSGTTPEWKAPMWQMENCLSTCISDCDDAALHIRYRNCSGDYASSADRDLLYCVLQLYIVLQGLVSSLCLLIYSLWCQASCACFGWCGKEVPCDCPYGRYLEAVRAQFLQYDTDEDGVLSGNEVDLFRAYLLRADQNYTESEVDNVLRGADVNGDGSLNWSEYLVAHKMLSEAMRARFLQYDTDEDGVLSGNELDLFRAYLLRADQNYTESEVDNVLRGADVNTDFADGTINWRFWSEHLVAYKIHCSLRASEAAAAYAKATGAPTPSEMQRGPKLLHLTVANLTAGGEKAALARGDDCGSCICICPMLLCTNFNAGSLKFSSKTTPQRFVYSPHSGLLREEEGSCVELNVEAYGTQVHLARLCCLCSCLEEAFLAPEQQWTLNDDGTIALREDAQKVIGFTTTGGILKPTLVPRSDLQRRCIFDDVLSQA